MEQGRYYIFEITDGGTMKKVSLQEYRSKEEAEATMKFQLQNLQAKRLIAVRVNN